MVNEEQALDIMSSIFGKYLEKSQKPGHKYIMLDIESIPDLMLDILKTNRAEGGKR